MLNECILTLCIYYRSVCTVIGSRKDCGSPYAVSDPLRIADYLADPLLDLSAEELFGAFVEFCHRIGMRVILDFVPRTGAVTAILSWSIRVFYWVDVASVGKYAPPKRLNWVLGSYPMRIWPTCISAKM